MATKLYAARSMSHPAALAGSSLLVLLAAWASLARLRAEPGPGRIEATETTRSVREVKLGPTGVPATLAIAGRVLNAKGHPVPDARLFLGDLANRQDSAPSVRATTGPDGRFQFSIGRSDLAASNSVGMGLSGPLLAAFAEGYGPAWADDLKIGDPEGLVFKLAEDDVALSGRLLDLEGIPVPGVTVRALQIDATTGADLSPWLREIAASKKQYFYMLNNFLRPLEAGLSSLIPTATTGADGRFRLAGFGRERLVSLLIQCPNIEAQVINVMTRLGPSSAVRFMRQDDGGPVAYENTIHAANFEIVAAPTRPIEGVVRDRDSGLPLPGVVVRADWRDRNAFPVVLYPLVDWPGDFLRTTTDANGRYRLTGLPARERVALRADPASGQPYHPASREFRNTPGAGATTIDFSLPTGVLVRGRVTDRATGEPVVALVEYSPGVDNPDIGRFRDTSEAEARPTDAEGRFAVVALRGPGLVTATMLGDRFLHAGLSMRGGAGGGHPFPKVTGRVSPDTCQAFAEISPGATTDVVACDLGLTPGPDPIVTVLGPDGEPLAGALVSGSPFDVAREGWWQSREKATFSVTGLTKQRIRALTFHHAGRRLAGSLVVRDSQAEPLVVQLRPWGTAKGRLVDGDGRPRPGVLLTYRGTMRTDERHPMIWPPPLDAMTDGEGGFSFEGLLPGREYTLGIAVTRGSSPRVGDSHSLQPGEVKELGDVREGGP